MWVSSCMLPDRFWMSSEFRGELKEKIKVKSYELKQKNYFKNLNKLNRLTRNLCPVVLRSPRFCLPLLQYG